MATFIDETTLLKCVEQKKVMETEISEQMLGRAVLMLGNTKCQRW